MKERDDMFGKDKVTLTQISREEFGNNYDYSEYLEGRPLGPDRTDAIEVPQHETKPTLVGRIVVEEGHICNLFYWNAIRWVQESQFYVSIQGYPDARGDSGYLRFTRNGQKIGPDEFVLRTPTTSGGSKVQRLTLRLDGQLALGDRIEVYAFSSGISKFIVFSHSFILTPPRKKPVQCPKPSPIPGPRPRQWGEKADKGEEPDG